MLSGLELLSFSPPGWGSAMLLGFVTSIEAAVGGFGFGLIIGIAGASGKLYGGPITRDLLACYTTIIRAVPELVLIVLLYYAGGDLLNAALGIVALGPVDISGLASGIFVIAIVQGAYCTEVLRGAIQAVPAGQFEAAKAYGMSPFLMLRRITLPAMLPHAIPGLSNLWLNTTKDTALLAVVGVSELTLVTRQAAGSSKAYFMFYCAAGVLYLVMTLGSNALLRRLEMWARRGATRTA